MIVRGGRTKSSLVESSRTLFYGEGQTLSSPDWSFCKSNVGARPSLPPEKDGSLEAQSNLIKPSKAKMRAEDIPKGLIPLVLPKQEGQAMVCRFR
jgi:hypothetical protein